MVLALKYWRRLSSLSIAALYLGQRRYFDNKKEVLELSYHRHTRATATTPSGPPLVICHGLYGYENYWPMLWSNFSHRLDADVYALDMRNHGSSPRSRSMDYISMAEDVLFFCQKHKLKTISLFGHSIGAKVAMAVALHPNLPPNLITHLIIEDVAPSKEKFFPEARYYSEMARNILQAKVSTVEELDRLLEALEPDLKLRAFIRTNMVLMAANEERLQPRIPPDILNHALENICGFPFDPAQNSWRGKTLLLQGYQSNYVFKRDRIRMKQYFPIMKTEKLHTGHWIHVEKPTQMADLVAEFINNARFNRSRLVPA